MGKISSTSNFSSVNSWQDLRRFSSAFCQEVASLLGGKLTFNENIQGVNVAVLFPNLGVSVAISHNLGYVPNGFFVVESDSPAIIYNGPEQNTATIIYLKSSVDNASVTLRVF